MKIGVIGHALVDYEYVVERLPAADDESRIISSYRFPGGSALNTAVGIKRLNHEPLLVANVGRDKRGSFLLNFVRRNGLSAEGLKIENGRSGYCIVIRSKSGEVSLISRLNVAEPLNLDEVRLEKLKQAEHIHITSLTSEAAGKSLRFFAKEGYAKSYSWDVGRITAGEDPAQILEILKLVDLAFLSEREAKKLGSGGNPEDTAERLSRSSAGLIILKKKRGAAAFRRGKKISEVEVAKDFPLVDSLGAGDAFAASFLVSYLDSKDIAKSLAKASVYASIKIGKRGGSSMPSVSEFEKVWNKVGKDVRYY